MAASNLKGEELCHLHSHLEISWISKTQHERTYLVEAESFQVPSTCSVLVDTPVDRETGLPFVEVKPVEAANVNALRTASPKKKQELKIKNEVARAKQINSNRRQSQKDRGDG